MATYITFGLGGAYVVHFQQIVVESCCDVLVEAVADLEAEMNRSGAIGPAPPPPSRKLHRPRVAVIGARLTGVSSAAHCAGHGFDVKIFEARSKEKGLGGIWSIRKLIVV